MCERNRIFLLICALAWIIGTTPGCLFGGSSGDGVDVTVTADDDDDADDDDVADDEDDDGEEDDVADDDEDDGDAPSFTAGCTAESYPGCSSSEDGRGFWAVLVDRSCEDYMTDFQANVLGTAPSTLSCDENGCTAGELGGWLESDFSTPLSSVDDSSVLSLVSIYDFDETADFPDGNIESADAICCDPYISLDDLSGTFGENNCVLGSQMGGGGGGGGGGGATVTINDISIATAQAEGKIFALIFPPVDNECTMDTGPIGFSSWEVLTCDGENCAAAEPISASASTAAEGDDICTAYFVVYDEDSGWNPGDEGAPPAGTQMYFGPSTLDADLAFSFSDAPFVTSW